METIVRNDKLTRVVLTGSESTGKSVLARELAAHYDVVLVPEFAREFALLIGRDIVSEDAAEIARGQIALEDAHASRSSRLLIQDTDLLSTAVYSEHYFNQRLHWIEKAAHDRRPDLYLLLEIDVPWVRDDVRDRGTRRDEMQDLFRKAVAASGSPFEVIRGNWEERSERARGAIDRLLAGS